MKNIKRILLGVSALGMLSCSAGNSDEDLTSKLSMDIGKSNAIIIPAPANTLGCDQIARQQTSAAGSVAGGYFTLPNPNIIWSGEEEGKPSEVRILALKFSLKSPKIGGEYSCLFSDIALGSLFYNSKSEGNNIIVNTWDGKLGVASSTGVNSTKALVTPAVSGGTADYVPCDLKCGGLTIAKNAGIFSITGEWQLTAVRKRYTSATLSEYEETPINIQGSFTVENVIK